MPEPSLPAPPPGACQPLSDADFTRLKAARSRLWTDPEKSCLTCMKKNNGTYRWYDQSREIAEYQCVCTDQWLMHMWFLNAGVPLNYQRLGWDDVQAVEQTIVDQVMQYAVEAEENIRSGRNLVLWSPSPGTGKSLLLYLLGKALMTEGFQVHCSQFNEIIDLFTSSWRDQSEREQWNRRVRNADVLAIDDLGKEHKGRIDMVEAMVDQIVRARVADSLPTIITTNLTPEQIRQGYGCYVMSLLSETADYIEVTGADFRPRRHEIALMERRLGLTRPITAV